MPEQKKKKRLSKRARRRKRQRIAFLSGLFLIVVLAVFGVSYAALYRYVHKVEENVICDNIYIGKVNVSGMTEKQAKEAVKKKTDEYSQLKLTMEVGDKTAETALSEMGFAVKDADKLVEQAVSYGKKGSIWKRYRAIRKLGKEKLVLDAEYTLDDELAGKIINERAVPLEKRAVNAKITHRGSGFEITGESEGEKVNVEASVEQITAYLNDKWKYEDFSLAMVQETEEPEIKRTDLESIQDELGSYSTDAGYGDRVTNLRRASELLNGTVLMPGEELSVVNATTPYTEENGYVSGSAYENGKVVQSIGGGLCQVSTTLYNAVLYAELEVMERSAHSMIVSYVDPSRDAAIAEGVKDFKFKNNYDTPILIEGYIDGNNQLRFYIYGKETRPEAREVEFESETLEKKQYTKKYVEDSESGIGAMNEEGSYISGRMARLWKVVYENGKEVSRDVINNSTYKASVVTVNVGTASDNPEASSVVRSAIATQDESKIWDAIGKAQALERSPQESAEESPEENSEESSEEGQ